MQNKDLNILVTLPAEARHRRRIEAACPGGNFRYVRQEALTPEDVADADVILGNIPVALISACRNLKLLQLGMAGTDGYPERMPAGAWLTNSSGAFGLAISEHMIGMVLAICKRLYAYHDNQNRCLWHDEGTVTSLEDAVVLSVGMGSIGGEFTRKCKALGSYTIGIRRQLREKPAFLDEIHTLDELDELLPRADVVALSLPSGAETNGLMDARRLRLMKPGAVLVNVGRGKAIVTDALQEVCAEGRIHAALDVTDPEPLPPEHPLWTTPNVHITPHISGFFHLSQTHDRIVSIAAQNLERYCAGEPLLNLVDSRTGYRVEDHRADSPKNGRVD